MATDTIRIWADGRTIVGTLTADIYPFASLTAQATGATVSTTSVTGVYTFPIVSPTAGAKYKFVLRDSGASPTFIGKGSFIALNTGVTIEELTSQSADTVAWNSLPTVALPATPTNITAGTITTVTNVTNAVTLPTIPTDWITANGIATDAIGSAEVSAAAVTKIQTGLATPTNITAATGVVLSGVTHTGR